jgi:hypothetical protein
MALASARPRGRMTARKATAVAVTTGITGGLLATGAPGALAAEQAPDTAGDSPSAVTADAVIVSHRRPLTADQIARAEITGTTEGRAILGQVAKNTELDEAGIPSRVFRFGTTTVIAPYGMAVAAAQGRDASGQTVYEASVVVTAGADAPQGGFATTPGPDQYFISAQGTFPSNGPPGSKWVRQVWWQIDKVNNFTPKQQGSNPKTYDFYRIFSYAQGHAQTGGDPFKRFFVQIRRNDWAGVSRPLAYEPPSPGGPLGTAAGGSTTLTIGFGGSLNVGLGYGPATVGGTVNANYSHAVTTPNEWIYPLPAASAPLPIGSGGSQYCKKGGAGNMAQQELTSRASVRVPWDYGGAASWELYPGMSTGLGNCP